MMKTISLIVASLGSTLAQRSASPIPNEGGFFYLVDSGQDLKAPGINGFDVTIGQQKISNMALSSSSHFLRVQDTNNTMWNNTDSYDLSKSRTGFKVIDKDPDIPVLNLTGSLLTVTGLPVESGNQLAFEQPKITTEFIFEDIKFELPEFKRSVDLYGAAVGLIVSVEDGTHLTTPIYNGFIGIAPYQSLGVHQDLSFMKQLSDNNVIENQVVAVNARDSADPLNNHEFTTTVKFGGWDKSMTETGELMILETKACGSGTLTWCYALESKNWTLGPSLMNEGYSKTVHLDPSIPYMYIPVADFAQMSNNMINSTIYTTGLIPFVDSVTKSIYWNLACDKVRENMPDYEFNLELTDINTPLNPLNKYVITLKKERMTIDGKYFGFNDRCYFPVFETDSADDGNYHLGSHALYEEYVVFDNTPYQFHPGVGYAQIGLAKLSTLSALTPIADLYLNGTGEDQTIVMGSNLNDSSVWAANTTTSPKMQAFDFKGLLSIGPKPDTPIPSGPDEPSWFKKNIVLVIVFGVVVLLVFIVLAYCLCKPKTKDPLGLYEHEKIMKARIQ